MDGDEETVVDDVHGEEEVAVLLDDRDEGFSFGSQRNPLFLVDVRVHTESPNRIFIMSLTRRSRDPRAFDVVSSCLE